MDEPQENALVFDAADLTWPGPTFENGSLIVGDFVVRIGPDGSEVLAAPDALVFPLGGPELEEVSGEGYARKGDDSTTWETLSIDLNGGRLFLPPEDDEPAGEDSY